MRPTRAMLALFALSCLGAPRAHATVPGFAGRIAFSGRGATDAFFQIFTMKPDGSGVLNLTPGTTVDCVNPAWSPDGKKIVFVREEVDPGDHQLHDHLWVMHANGSAMTQLTSGALNASHPAWSPDGARIAFDDATALWIANADGSNPTRVPPASAEESFPAWSPDGTKLAFQSFDAATGWDVVTAAVSATSAELTGRTNVTAELDSDYNAAPDWSPDGKKIVFVSHQNGAFEYDVWTMNADGSGKALLAGGTGERLYPAWAPDGRHLVFDFLPSGGPQDVFSVRPDGGGLANLTNNTTPTASSAEPRWQPTHGCQ